MPRIRSGSPIDQSESGAATGSDPVPGCSGSGRRGGFSPDPADRVRLAFGCGWPGCGSVGQPAFERGDFPFEAPDRIIARVRCSINGRGPRRSIGPGAFRGCCAAGSGGGSRLSGCRGGSGGGGLRFTLAWSSLQGGGGRGPEFHHSVPVLPRLPILRQRRPFALPDDRPSLDQRWFDRPGDGENPVSGLMGRGIGADQASPGTCAQQHFLGGGLRENAIR